MSHPEPKPVLDDLTLYFGDNGECFCGLHAGYSARFTGRTIYGSKVRKITASHLASGHTFECETCRARKRVVR